MCIILPNFIKIGQTVAKIWWFNGFFQNGGCPPLWIWTTHDDYFVVFVVLQNLVDIDLVLLILWNFQYVTSLAWKCLFTPQNWARSTKPPKGTPLCKSASFESSSVKIRRRACLTWRWVPGKAVNEKIVIFCTDLHQIWHSRRGRRRNHLYQIFGDRLRGVDSVGGSKIDISHWCDDMIWYDVLQRDWNLLDLPVTRLGENNKLDFCLLYTSPSPRD